MIKIACILSALLVVFMTAGCGLLSDGRAALEAPSCMLLDDYLYWEAVENAAGYTVSVNGEEKPVQEGCGYLLPRDENVSVKVRAEAKDGSKEYRSSAYSAAVLRTADPVDYVELNADNFSDYADISVSSVDVDTAALDGSHEAYAIEFDENFGNYEVVVPATVRAVRLTSADGSSAGLAFRCEPRTETFVLELHSVTVNAYPDRGVVRCDSETGLSDRADVVIRSLGDGVANALCAGRNSKTGSRGKDTDKLFAKGGRGGDGAPGYAAVSAPCVAVTGDNALGLFGGSGSGGGQGGSSASNQGGDGGDGGRGGDAVEAQKLFVNIAGGRELSLYGGAGGPRGELGSGINLGGGLSSNDAEDGADGVGFAGTPVILAGAVL